MNPKIIPSKPFLMLLYGYPGSGKSTFARQFVDEMPIVHLRADKFQHDLHEITRGQASSISSTLLEYMTKEFLNSGVSVILDVNASKKKQRRMFGELARKAGATTVLVWFQIDPESAFVRTQKRDRRKTEDKYASQYSKSDFETAISESQNPDSEDYVVVSGKHTFHSQRSSVMKKLYEYGILSQEDASQKVIKPGLVNLIPQRLSGKGDFPRRNISIR